MSSIRLVSFASFALLPSLALVACGGEEGVAPDAEPIVLVDSMPIDAVPSPDAAGCLFTECPVSGVCTDLDTDVTNCGKCDNVCQGGATCGGGDCACITDYVPANPTFLFNQVSDGGIITGVSLGFGVYGHPGGGGIADVLVAGYDMAGVTTGAPGYDLSTIELGTPPLLGVTYDFDIQTQTPSSVVHFATAGTLVFDTVCTGGFSGHATDVTFSGVSGGLTSPMIDPEGCSFTVASVSFAFGTACPVK